MKRLLSILFILANLPQANAQYLSLEDAIGKALKHNYDIRISDVASQQAAANNTLGNAGFLPSVSATGGINASNNNSHIEYNDGTFKNNTSATSISETANLTLSYTIFAAGRAFLVKKVLTEQEKVSISQLKAQMQSTVSQVIQTYALVSNDQRQLIATDTAIELAKVRMDLSKAKYDIGTDAKVNYLQARVDYNASRFIRLTQEGNRATDRATLNQLMGEEADQEYIVADSLALNLAVVPANKEVLQQHNFTLDAAKHSAAVSKINASIARTYYLPNLSLNGGYGYTHTNSDAGVYVVNRGFGPTGGLNLNVPIFLGGNVRRQVKVASLQALSDELVYERQNTILSSQYRSAWRQYQAAVADYNLEIESIGYAKENLMIQEARFRVGIATTLETREAENSYTAALARLATASYNVKVYETRLAELEGKLVQ